MTLTSRLFHTPGRLLGEKRKLSDRERIRAKARQMRAERGLEPLAALEPRR